MNLFLLAILLALLGRYALEIAADWLNLRHIREELPPEFAGWYDAEKYRASQRYLREKTAFEIVSDTLHTAGLIAFLLAGGFALLDGWARGFGCGPVVTGLAFAGMLMVISTLFDLPFSIYDTFVVEQKYGFNRMTPGTFALDHVKTLALAAAIGGAVFGAVVWFFEAAGPSAWLYAWAAVVAFEVVLVFLAPYVIMPLFNKFVPLEEGALRGAIERYAESQRFRMKGVFKMDGSRRSSKTNAFFTGLGRSRRIVLYDTLIEKHAPAELVGIVAHEMGHHKLGHIPWAIGRSVLFAAAAFYLLSLFMGNGELAAAFGVKQVSTYTSLVFFGLLYTPLGMLISMAEGLLSRRHELEADAYAARTTGEPGALVTALKRLSVDNLSNLTPHPFKVWLSYSHPPVLARIRALNESVGPAVPQGS